MVSRTANAEWLKEFSASIKATLKDSRLWFIVVPSIVICAVALLLFRNWFGAVISFAVGLIASRLVNNIEALPRPDERKLAASVYRTAVLPAAIGVMVIPSSELLARLWFMPWHWFHTSDATPACSYLLTGVFFDWLGVLIAPALTALLTKDRAVFATFAGLLVYIPLEVTDSFARGGLTTGALLFSKACQVDFDPSTDLSSFNVGAITAILVRALISIFVAKVVSTWVYRRTSCTNLAAPASHNEPDLS